MPAKILFFDTCYLVRLYLEDAGYEAVRELAGTGLVIATAWHAQAEVVAALHRAARERHMEPTTYRAVLALFSHDRAASLFRWLPLTRLSPFGVKIVYF